MDNDDILVALGKLQGQMAGIGRELGDIKKLVSESNASCRMCKNELCGRISYLEVNGAKISQENAADLVILTDKVNHIETAQNVCEKVDAAESHWTDSVYVKVGAVFTAIGTIAGLAVGIVAYLK